MKRLLSALLVFAALPVLSQELDWVFTRNEASARERLVGNGIPTLSLSSPADGIEWREHHSMVDESGGTHTFYRQYFRSVTDSILIEGSEVGVHRSASGALRLVAGRQVTSVVPENRVLFGPAGAVVRAAQAAGERPGLFRETLDVASVETAKRLEYTSLVLVATGRETFRFVYRTPVQKLDGWYAEAEIDSSTGEWRTHREYGANANCSPSNPTATPVSVSATGLRGITRNIKATLGGSRPSASYDYEAYAKSETSLPKVLVYHTVDPNNTAHSGFACGTNNYTIHPLRSIDTPMYAELNVDGNGSVDWYGKDAADAFHHARETMYALSGMGMNSWNGVGGEARLVVRVNSMPGNARFYNGPGNVEGPSNAVLLGPPAAGQGYGAAAALDTVAHEFGHGVIYSLNGTGGFLDSSLDEGFADVIGIMTEKKRQPAGTGLEQSSDWSLFEDEGCGYARTADADDLSGHSFCGFSVDNKYHVNDDPFQGDNAGHRTGNMLVVAYKLLAEGGKNVWCNANPSDTSCATAMTGVGVHAASRILFDTLRYYLTYNVAWSDLPFFAREAAFNAYNRCSTTGYNAQAEQAAVQNAFAGIGYPSSGEFTCMFP